MSTFQSHHVYISEPASSFEQKGRRLQQCMEDPFGAGAAELEPPELQYAAKQGNPSEIEH